MKKQKFFSIFICTLFYVFANIIIESHHIFIKKEIRDMAKDQLVIVNT